MTNVITDNADNDFASTMKFEGIASIGDILAIPQGDLDTLQRSDPQTQEAIPVRRFVKGIITALQGIVHQRSLDGNPLDDSNWTSLTKEAFDEYRMTASFSTFSQTIGRNPAMQIGPQQAQEVQLRTFANASDVIPHCSNHSRMKNNGTPGIKTLLHKPTHKG